MQLSGHTAMSLEDISDASPVQTRWGCFSVSDSHSGVAEMDQGSQQAQDHLSSSSYSASRGVPHYADPRSEFPDGDYLQDPRAIGEWQGNSTTAEPAPTPPSNTTQVMVRNILNRYTKKDLMEFLDNSGLKGTYNGVYLPIGRTRKGKSSNLGYAFVDFRSLEHVDLCCRLLNGVQLGAANNQKRIEVVPASAQYPSRKFHKCPKKASDGDETSNLISGASMLSATSTSFGPTPHTSFQHTFQPQFHELQPARTQDCHQQDLYQLDQIQLQACPPQPMPQQTSQHHQQLLPQTYQHQQHRHLPLPQEQPYHQQQEHQQLWQQQQQQQPQQQYCNNTDSFQPEGFAGHWAQPAHGQFEHGCVVDSNLLGGAATPTTRAVGPGSVPRHLTSLSPCDGYLDEIRVGRFSV